MNFRKSIFLISSKLRGIEVPCYLREFAEADHHPDINALQRQKLSEMLDHCKTCVPYYKKLFSEQNCDFKSDPKTFLAQLPILTKNDIRRNFESLKSSDLDHRKWFYNTSGGSTGEPVRFIQDNVYSERSAAIAYLYSAWIGCDIGESQILLWGSEREIFYGKPPLKTQLGNWLRNSQTLNAFQMTTEKMRSYIDTLNRVQPKQIIAYAQAIYELAKFAESEKLQVKKQNAILASAGTLYPFMREKLESVFGCPGRIYNRYGSREVGLIASERPGYTGLVAAPLCNYIQIVDERGNPVPYGVEGEIIVTNLMNFAMPLLRYAIGDRGVLEDPKSSGGNGRQILQKVSGRNVDAFRTSDGTLIDGEYFTHLLYFRDWLNKFQVVQKSPQHLIYKLVLNDQYCCPAADLEEIRVKSKMVLGEDIQIDFEYLSDIPPSASGKYRYTISEVAQN